MNILQIKNYVIDESLINIIYKLKEVFPSRKLNDIKLKSDEIILTCVNSDHKNAMEANPDAHINLDASKARFGSYHCFGCGVKTDFVGFVALYLDSTRKIAEDWLIKNYGKLSTEVISIDDNICLDKVDKKKSIYFDESQYQSYCPYLQKRKISREVCERFHVKYDPKQRVVIFPVYDTRGNLVMLPTRSIDYKFFHLDPSVEKPVYCLDYIIKNNIKTVLLVEGLIDCLTGLTMNIPTIATLGNISDSQIESINNSGIFHIYLGMDNDEAGRKFTALLKNKLSKRILITEVEWPANRKDINELTIEEQQEFIKKYNFDIKK